MGACKRGSNVKKGSKRGKRKDMPKSWQNKTKRLREPSNGYVRARAREREWTQAEAQLLSLPPSLPPSLPVVCTQRLEQGDAQAKPLRRKPLRSKPLRSKQQCSKQKQLALAQAHVAMYLQGLGCVHQSARHMPAPATLHHTHAHTQHTHQRACANTGEIDGGRCCVSYIVLVLVVTQRMYLVHYARRICGHCTAATACRVLDR